VIGTIVEKAMSECDNFHVINDDITTGTTGKEKAIDVF
jgi:hypothetical protein